MMKKIALGLSAAVLILLIVRQKDQAVETLSKVSQKFSNVKTERQPSQTTASIPNAPNIKEDVLRPELIREALDTQVSMEERLKDFENLSEVELLRVAVSANPFKALSGSHNHKHEAHSLQEFRYQREESFRIMSLQKLEKALLKNSISSDWMTQIIQSQTASPTVKAVAQKILEFADSGLSYSDMAEAAILKIKIPK